MKMFFLISTLLLAPLSFTSYHGEGGGGNGGGNNNPNNESGGGYGGSDAFNWIDKSKFLQIKKI